MSIESNLAATLEGWAAWSPGLEDPAAWRGWAEKPSPLEREGIPAARFLPAMLRRRCTPLSKAMLRAAFDCCDEPARAGARTVFASRHGSINESIELIEAVVHGQPLSPAKFTHTVHNAQAGLFSIAAGNRCASSSLAAQGDTFPYGYLEALTHLDREPGRPVLLVVGDVPLAPTFAPLVEEPSCVYALALLLARGGEGPRLGFEMQPAGTPPERASWPQAIEFVRWLLSDETSLSMDGRCQQFRWHR